MKKTSHVAMVILFLMGMCLCGCSSQKTVKSSLEGRVFDVQSKLYVVGHRKYQRNIWYLGTPESVGVLVSLIDEYEHGNARRAQNQVSKIYGELNTGDQIRIAGSQWVNAGSAFSGYLTQAEILTGSFKGTKLRLEGLVLSNQTNQPVEDWNPYKETLPVPATWKLDERYLKLADATGP